jgi:hypothetical protein
MLRQSGQFGPRPLIEPLQLIGQCEHRRYFAAGEFLAEYPDAVSGLLRLSPVQGLGTSSVWRSHRCGFNVSDRPGNAYCAPRLRSITLMVWKMM